MKKILTTLFIGIFLFGNIAKAATSEIPISVPSATSSGYMLVSTTTGRYIATTTDPAHFGSVFATSTATSTFQGGLNTAILGGCLAVNGNCLSSADTSFSTTSANYWIQGVKAPFAVSTLAATSTATSTFVGGLYGSLLSAPYFHATSSTATSTLYGIYAKNAVLTDLTSALVITSSGGALAEYTGTSCTNQFPRSLDALGVATCATVQNTDLANSSLTVTAGSGLIGGGSVSLGGTVTLTAQVGTSTVPTLGHLAYWTGVGTPSTLGTVATTSIACSGFITCTGFNALGSASTITTTGTLALASGGTNASLSGANQVVFMNSGNTALSLDSDFTFTAGNLLTATYASTTMLTSSQGATFATVSGNVGIGTTTPSKLLSVNGNGIVSGTLTVEGKLFATTTRSFNIASTTLDAMGKSFNIGTSTFLLMNNPEAVTLIGFYCTASTTGTALVRAVHDSGSGTETNACTSGSYTNTVTNNTFTAFENFNFQASSTAGAVNRITVTPVYRITAP